MKNVLIILFTLFTCQAFGHKFYVSIAELAYNQEKNRIEGSLKLTAHDFELMLEDKFDQRIHLEEVSDSSVIGQYVQKYLAAHFKVYSNNVLAKPNYIGKEVTARQELFFYFTFNEIVNPKSIKIMNNILFEHFSKQQNIIHYKYKKQTKSVTLLPSKTTGLFSLTNNFGTND